MADFRLAFKCDNAAFASRPFYEIKRVLQVAAIKAGAGETAGLCFDINGNHVGGWAITGIKAESDDAA